MSSIINKIGIVKQREVNEMTFFGYVNRQKEIIRGRHAGEEVLFVRGGNKIIAEGEGAFGENIIFSRSESFGEHRACEGKKSVEQLLKELSEMKGLNRKERERFAANAV